MSDTLTIQIPVSVSQEELALLRRMELVKDRIYRPTFEEIPAALHMRTCGLVIDMSGEGFCLTGIGYAFVVEAK